MWLLSPELQQSSYFSRTRPTAGPLSVITIFFSVLTSLPIKSGFPPFMKPPRIFHPPAHPLLHTPPSVFMQTPPSLPSLTSSGTLSLLHALNL